MPLLPSPRKLQAGQLRRSPPVQRPASRQGARQSAGGQPAPADRRQGCPRGSHGSCHPEWRWCCGWCSGSVPSEKREKEVKNGLLFLKEGGNVQEHILLHGRFRERTILTLLYNLWIGSYLES
jgi:hypothetical protein